MIVKYLSRTTLHERPYRGGLIFQVWVVSSDSTRRGAHVYINETFQRVKFLKFKFLKLQILAKNDIFSAIISIFSQL